MGFPTGSPILAVGASPLIPPTYVLGLDPGLGGAFAVVNPLDTISGVPRVVCVHDMPTIQVRGKRTLDHYQLARLISEIASQVRIAIIEEVGVMTGKEGRVSMFNFGRTTGVAEGIIAANMIATKLVKPAVWKMSMGLGRDKDESRQKASRMFPRDSHLWPLKKHDGRAEAVLLATIGFKL